MYDMSASSGTLSNTHDILQDDESHNRPTVHMQTRRRSENTSPESVIVSMQSITYSVTAAVLDPFRGDY